MVPPGARVAVTVNALDNQTSAIRATILDRELGALSRLGYRPDELDLRNYFDGREALAEKLRDYSLVWCSGGNAFVLLLAMRIAGLDRLLRELLAADAIAYGGYSAGAVVAGDSLRGIEKVDRIDDFPPDYPRKEIIYDGLSLVPYTIVPHWKSNHPESPLIDEVVALLRGRGTPFKALRDGEVDLRG